MDAEIAPHDPISVPIMKPCFLPIRFIKREAGNPANIVPIRCNESGKVASALLVEISKPTSEEAETVRLLVLAENAKQMLRSKIVFK